jgi:hypothetical protein
MTPKHGPSEQGPNADPFGTGDPYWERHYGISGLKRIGSTQQAERRWSKRQRRGEPRTVLIISIGAAVLLFGILTLLFWGISALVQAFN